MGQRESGEQQFRGPEGSRRWRPLPPRGSHPCPAAGTHDRPLFSPSATRPFPRPSRASSLSPPPHPPSSRPFPQPLGHSLVPLGARSGDGAILGSRGSRAPGSGRQRAASTRDLRTADRSAQYGGGRLLGLPGEICCTSLLLSGHRPEGCSGLVTTLQRNIDDLFSLHPFEIIWSHQDRLNESPKDMSMS
ncbi:neuronal acetylcholine receptor subunit alpha-4-like [Mustela erminea]|uniref:neuronal acetylcholine receptor subunit alpha-4-like n=1 Tax=Mustela erminea TaxID=36723 RepID=UPI001386DE50|nr:neuronal acetylcholine receptor subunit alpha-4-like [Mustela erminea]